MWFVVINILFLIFGTIAGSESDECAKDWFDCANGKCIRKLWQCDGDNDCGNLKDEENCEIQMYPKECLSSQFKCTSDNHCIPERWHCDGERDCDDGSDEINCAGECNDGDFKCANGLCLVPKLQCDGQDDCGDASDEVNCGDVCGNFSCSQNCKSTIEGPQCYCNDGYVLDPRDKKTCLDIDECQEEGLCSHECMNTAGSYKCLCKNGYELVNSTCRAKGANPLLVYSTIKEIRSMNLVEQHYSLVRRASDNAAAVHIDPKNMKIYWTEIANKSIIYSAKTDGSEFRTVLSDGLLVAEDVAVDYIANNIYITDSGLKQVLVCTINGSKCTILHNENIEKPRSIDLDINEGFMYWSDYGDHTAGIYRSGMDGSNRIALVSSKVVWPNGIAIDHSMKRLYWVDAKLNTIEYISLNGSFRKVIYSRLDSVFHPYHLAVFEDTIYWTDWAKYSLESCNKFTGSNLKVLDRQDRPIMGVHVYHPVLTATVSNPCWSNECSHMCLISPVSGFRCTCPHEFQLDEDEKTCRRIGCSGNDFQCKNGRCILNSWRCDKKNDCVDNSDEEDCPTSAPCLSDQMACLNGECIAHLWRCDGEEDCSDGSDELKCNETTCPGPAYYPCDNGQCILKSWVCDTSADCSDSSDEKNCTKQCKANDFKCSNGKCLDPSLRCDGRNDCSDGSDELSCVLDSNCQNEQYQCKSGNCIYHYEVCDGHADCIGGEDELNCTSPARCNPEEVVCPSLIRCIPQKWICDGDDDCTDGFDEANCYRPKTTQKPKLTPVTDSPCDTFSCYLTSQCISWDKVCDGHSDCDDSFDEGPQCSRACVNNGGCSHICQKMPSGPRCFCYEGYRLLPDNKTCVDIDECEILGTCSHFCNNTKGGFECTCAQGYVLHDHKLCKAVGSATLVYLQGSQIRGLDLLSNSKHVIVNATNVEMQGMDYDALSEIFFWTDKYAQSINLYSAVTGKRNVAIRSSLIPTDIHYDWITGNLYIKNASSSIVACTKDVKYCKTLIKPSNMLIHNIDIAPHVGLMFWTNEQQHQNTGYIERSEMDGSHRTVIVNDQVLSPSAISVDQILNKIYWIDMKLNTLECADFYGLQRRQVVQSGMYHPMAITVFEDYIYLADYVSESITKCNKFTGLDCAKITETNMKTQTLLIVHKAMQPQGVNECLDAKCTQLCLLRRSGSVCACDDMDEVPCVVESEVITPISVVKCPRDYCHGDGECIVKDGQYLCEADDGSGDDGNGSE